VVNILLSLVWFRAKGPVPFVVHFLPPFDTLIEKNLKKFCLDLADDW
jgi:hypothetical protein